jgi:hypothetical protein
MKNISNFSFYAAREEGAWPAKNPPQPTYEKKEILEIYLLQKSSYNPLNGLI